MEVLFILFVLSFFMYLLIRLEQATLSYEEQALMKHGRTGMGINNATVIVVLRDHDFSNEIFYVNQLVNPESALANPKYFAEFIYYADVYESRDKAIAWARTLEKSDATSRGVLIYDGLSSYSLGQALENLNDNRRYVG